MRWRILFKGQYRVQATKEYIALSEEFMAFIRRIHDPTKRQIVMMYYKDVRSEVWIADRLHYSESQIKRLKRDTIESINEKPRD